jgi:hypothetical protein
MLDITSTIEEKVYVKLAPKTASGKPATVDGIPVWNVASPATVEVDEDGMGAFLVSADTVGSSAWSVEADADLGDGIRTISEGGTYTYTDAQAEALGVTASTPVPKTEG